MGRAVRQSRAAHLLIQSSMRTSESPSVGSKTARWLWSEKEYDQCSDLPSFLRSRSQFRQLPLPQEAAAALGQAAQERRAAEPLFGRLKWSNRRYWIRRRLA